jgi:lysophospholipase L1-like esterase
MPTDSPRFRRYVALGDSSTAGIDDPDGAGGYLGWSQRFARQVAGHSPGLQYANFAARGLTTAEVRAGQLAPALALRPDLATVFCGTNDVTGRRFDPAAVGADLAALFGPLTAQGATVLTFTLPDLSPVMPLARLIAPRIAALNREIDAAARAAGARLVDFAAYPVATDARLWSEDRIHANAAGHARIAAALAHALGLPGADTGWQAPLPPLPPPRFLTRTAAELRWWRRHLLPWLAAGGRASPAPPPKSPHLAPP